MPEAKLKATIDLDGSGFKRGIDTVKSQAASAIKDIEGLAKGQGAIGGWLMGWLGTGAALVGLHKVKSEVEEMISKAKEIKEFAQLLNVDRELAQRISNVADPEKVSKGLAKIAEAQQAIITGEDKDFKLAKNLAILGVSLEDIRKKDYRQVFFDIAEGMKAANMTGERLAAFTAIFGAKAESLIPAFKKGFNSPVANRGVTTESDLDEFEQLGKSQKELAGPWKNLATQGKLWAARWWTGLIGLATTIPAGTSDLFGSGGHQKEMQEATMMNRIQNTLQAKLNTAKEKRIKLELEAAEAAAKKAEVEKKTTELRKTAEERTKKLQEQTSENEGHRLLRQLDPEGRLQLLGFRDKGLASEIEKTKKEIAQEGDADGSKKLRLETLRLQRSQNQDDIEQEGKRHPSPIKLNRLQQIGAAVLSPITGNDKGNREIVSRLDRLIEATRQVNGRDRGFSY
jgi:hypothetical protein